MTVIIDAEAQSAVDSGARGVGWLIDMEFDPTPVYFTTAPVSVMVGLREYRGFGELIGVGDLAESENVSAERLSVSIAIVNKAMLAATIGNVQGYRGRTARLYLQLFNAQFQPAGAPVLRWSGKMDRVQVTRKPSELSDGTKATGRIEMQCSRSGMARARKAQGLRLTHEQQQQRYPGDTGLRYVRTLIAEPARWLSKRFQEI